MATGRMRRVDEAIRQVIGDAVAGDLKDPRVGFVTVTDVRTSPDLRHARVYVSVLGERGGAAAETDRERTLAGDPGERLLAIVGGGAPALAEHADCARAAAQVGAVRA